jgi:hypothetical protein
MKSSAVTFPRGQLTVTVGHDLRRLTAIALTGDHRQLFHPSTQQKGDISTREMYASEGKSMTERQGMTRRWTPQSSWPASSAWCRQHLADGWTERIDRRAPSRSLMFRRRLASQYPTGSELRAHPRCRAMPFTPIRPGAASLISTRSSRSVSITLLLPRWPQSATPGSTPNDSQWRHPPTRCDFSPLDNQRSDSGMHKSIGR